MLEIVCCFEPSVFSLGYTDTMFFNRNFMPHTDSDQDLINKLNRETAKITWRELQRFYAAGKIVHIEKSLDLIQVAVAFSKDNKAYISELMESGKLALVNDESAALWLEQDATVWSVVIAPWVIIQVIN